MTARSRTRAGDRRPDPDRRSIHGWVNAGSILVGLWVLAPLITRMISFLVGDDVRLTLARPDSVTAPDGTELLGLSADVPVDLLGDGARTALILGTVVEVAAIMAMLVVVTVVMRSVAPRRALGTRAKGVSIAVVMIAGLIGFIGSQVVTSAGVFACADLYGSCTGGRTWDDPLSNAFLLAGIGLALVFALVRSESVARHDAEGLV